MELAMAARNYLVSQISSHVAAILDSYIENPDDVDLATLEIVEALKSEMRWAGVNWERQ